MILVLRVELSGGDLREHLRDGIAVLPLDQDAAVLEHRDHADGADVAQIFAAGGGVWKPDGVLEHMEDTPVKNFP